MSEAKRESFEALKVSARMQKHPIPWLVLALLIPLCFVSVVSAFAGGAPHHRCSNLVPFHGAEPQAMSPPYEILVSPGNYSPSGTITVTLRGLDGATFQGFAVTAHRRLGDTEDLVGSFNIRSPEDTRGNFWYSESSKLPNCVTHAGMGEISEVTFDWIAPANSVGDVIFITPVVKSFHIYWAKVTSAVVVANVPSQDAAFPPLNIGSSPSPISGSCGTNFGCVRSPALCDLANCEVYVKFLEAEGRLKLELQATGSYISLGLSDDNKMKDDLTITCTARNGYYGMQIGYNPNYAHLNERHRWTYMQDKYIAQLNGNRIRCEFSLSLSINITTYPTARLGNQKRNNRTFNLFEPHYVFIAYGETYPDTSSLEKHVELPAITDDKVNLLGRGSYSAHRISALRRAHGSVMLLAWQVLLPLGANLAMFYRSLFSKSLGGVQLWFHLHRSFVLSAFVLTGVGLLLIFSQNDWSWSYSNPTTVVHGAMGLSLLCLAAIQILMGMLRPDKDAPRRPLFRLAHQIVGYTTMSLADATMITIGFLVSLPKSYRISHLLLAFIWLAYHIIFRIVIGAQITRWNSKALLLANKPDAQVKWEQTKLAKLRIFGITFLVGMLIILLAWFTALMLF